MYITSVTPYSIPQDNDNSNRVNKDESNCGDKTTEHVPEPGNKIEKPGLSSEPTSKPV